MYLPENLLKISNTANNILTGRQHISTSMQHKNTQNRSVLSVKSTEKN